MNKAELVEAIQAGAELDSKSKAESALNAMLGAIKKELGKGGTVALVGFGTFSVSKRAARTGKNPQTGATIKIAARKVPKFSAGSELKKIANGEVKAGAAKKAAPKKAAAKGKKK
jgi:DNA-binding protein HU-beta